MTLEYCIRLLDYWVLGAANAVGLWDATVTLLGYWVLGTADAARLWDAAVTLLGC